MNRKIFTLLLAINILPFCLPAVGAAGGSGWVQPPLAADITEADWDALEKSLYIHFPVAPSEGENKNPILMGGTLDLSKVAERYATQIHVTQKENFDGFVKHLREKKTIADLLTKSGDYFTTVSGPNDPIPGTACFRLDPDIHVETVAIADEGRSYQPNFTDALKGELINSGLDLKQATLRSVAITGLFCGIQINDGVHECVWANTADWNILPTGKLFTLEDLAGFMETNREHLVC